MKFQELTFYLLLPEASLDTRPQWWNFRFSYGFDICLLDFYRRWKEKKHYDFLKYRWNINQLLKVHVLIDSLQNLNLHVDVI